LQKLKLSITQFRFEHFVIRVTHPNVNCSPACVRLWTGRVFHFPKTFIPRMVRKQHK